MALRTWVDAADTSENNKTCAGRPGSFMCLTPGNVLCVLKSFIWGTFWHSLHVLGYRYELQDSATSCDWGVDFVKIDHCGTAVPEHRAATATGI